MTAAKRASPDPGRVLNYTTAITPARSLADIQALLVAHGASAITVQFDENRMAVGVEFRIQSNAGVEQTYIMAANWKVVRARMILRHNNEVRQRYARNGVVPYAANRYLWIDDPGSYEHRLPKLLDDQAKRTAWRILKDAIEVMLNLSTAGIADPGQVFFGFASLDTGGTVYEAYAEHRALNSGH